MAKRKVNKTKLIENAVLASPDKKPKEIAASLKRYGITPSYVSNVKSKMKVDPETLSDSEGSVRKIISGQARTTDALDAAIKFVQDCGGLKQARAALEKIELIKRL